MDAIKDLSQLTSLPYISIKKILSLLNDIMSHSFKEMLQDHETSVSVDIGIGTLTLFYVNDSIGYKFIPSYELETKLIKATNNKEDDLVLSIEKSLTDRLINSYKELL